MKSKNIINEKSKNRISLTMFFAFIVFIVLFISVVLAAATAFLFSYLGWFDTGITHDINLSLVMVCILVLSLVIGFGTAVVFMKIPLRPLIHLIDKMDALSKGDFKARLSFGKKMSSYPLFKETAESFNKMAEELEKTEMLRSDFINNFSHEFKTPIVSIAGFAKLLKRDNISEEQKREFIDIIEEESLRLSAMANNVLSLTKVENQSILTDVVEFNLSEQIRSCVLLLENKWTEKRISVIPDVGEIYISANEELTKLIWINLIDNAIKFSPTDSTVEITAVESQKEVMVSVSNKGITIPKEKQEKIFNKFYQADESHSGKGNGVGLAIVKRVTELHRGEIRVSSENDVTVFEIRLPKC